MCVFVAIQYRCKNTLMPFCLFPSPIISQFAPSFSMETSVRGPSFGLFGVNSIGLFGVNSMVSSNLQLVSVWSGRGAVATRHYAQIAVWIRNG